MIKMEFQWNLENKTNLKEVGQLENYLGLEAP